MRIVFKRAIYVRLLSFRSIKIAWAIEILSERQWPVLPAESIRWLLMTSNRGIKVHVMISSSNGNIFFALLARFVWGIHRSTVNSPQKGQWHGALTFSWTWTKGWVYNRDAGDLRCHRTHDDVTVVFDQNISEYCSFSSRTIKHSFCRGCRSRYACDMIYIYICNYWQLYSIDTQRCISISLASLLTGFSHPVLDVNIQFVKKLIAERGVTNTTGVSLCFSWTLCKFRQNLEYLNWFLNDLCLTL